MRPTADKAAMMVPSADQSPAEKPAALRWTAPTGWKALGGSSMRLETFAVDRGARTGLCTVIKLGGGAGGVEANIKRWLGQIDQPIPPAEELSAFVEKQERFKTEGGLDGVLCDLTAIGTQGPDADSMLVALFPLGDMTAFVKLAAPVALLREEKAAFASFCKSFRRGGD